MRLSAYPRWLPDAITLVALSAVAWLVAHNYLQASLFAWGDHPGQFMRLWYPLTVSLPQSGRLVDWNPFWYAGYPELQFYPPGHVLLGIALYLLTLGLLSPERVYNLIPFVALVLPAFTCFALWRIVLAPLGHFPARIAGLTSALLALSFTPMWGGLDAVTIGLMGERLAFGVTPLVLLAGWKLVEHPSVLRLTGAALLLAALVLFHPFHAPAVVFAVIAYSLTRGFWPREREISSARQTLWLWLSGWLLLAIGLIAWWLVPLVLRYSPYAAALVRANLDQVMGWFDAGPVRSLWLAALPALVLIGHKDWRIRMAVAVLALLVALVPLGIWLDYQLLVNRLHLPSLDPIRFMASYYLALLLLTGAAAGAATSRFLWRLPLLGAIALTLILVALLPIVPKAWRQVRERTQFTEQFTLSGMLQHPAFAGYWEALRDDPTQGRVLFVFNYLPLLWPDGSTTPTTINSMTPYFTGREIVGGTFSHWSPVARLLWVGDPWARVLPAQVELEDNQRLFGIPWEQMDAKTLHAAVKAQNVTTVVARAEDVRARALLDSSPQFRPYWNNGYFYLYHVASARDEWVEATSATVHLAERSPRRWVIAVDGGSPGAVLTVKMTYYPLWQATVNGRPVAIEPNASALQQIELPAGAPYTVSLSYRSGWPERIGFLVTVASLATLGFWLWRSHAPAWNAGSWWRQRSHEPQLVDPRPASSRAAGDAGDQAPS